MPPSRMAAGLRRRVRWFMNGAVLTQLLTRLRCCLYCCLYRLRKHYCRLEAAHALIDAYKHHLSDEVASHHQREETWMAVQTEWEKLEQELNAEIDS